MKIKNRTNANKQVLTIIITIVYAISIGSGLMLPWIINASADEYPDYPDDGYLYESLEGNVFISDRTMMTLNQTVAKSGADVIVENVTWYFVEDFKIEEGAILTVFNSSFLAVNDSWRGFDNYGSFSLNNCTILNTTTAVMSTDGTLSLNECEIGNTVYGINVSGSDDPMEPEVISITNSTIRRCIEGVNLVDASASIANNMFDGNQYGLNIIGSTPVVLNNTFKWSLYHGITYDSLSEPTLLDNIYDGKGPHYTYMGNWIPDEKLTFENYVIDVEGELTLSGENNISLLDVTLTAESIHIESGTKFSADSSSVLLSSGIWVSEEAELSLSDASVRAQNTSLPINISLMGKSTISYTDFFFLQGNPEDELTPWEGGIEIFIDDVSIDNSTIRHCSSSGICVYNCTPTINDNTITDCGYAGIYWEGDYQPEAISPGDTNVLVSELSPFDFGDDDEEEDYIPPEEAPNSTLEDLFDSLDHLILDEMEDYWLLVNDTSNAETLKFIGKDRRDLEFGVLSKGYKGNGINLTSNANDISPEECGYEYSFDGVFDDINLTYTNDIEGMELQFRIADIDVPDPNGTDLLLRNRFGWSGGAMYVEDDDKAIHMPGSTFSSSGISIMEPSSGEAEYILSKPIATYTQNGSEMSFDCNYYITLEEDFLYLDILANLTSLSSAFDVGADEVLVNVFMDFGSDIGIENCPLSNGDVIEISHISDDEYYADDIYFQKYDSEKNPIGNQICIYNGSPEENIGELLAIPDENNNIMVVFLSGEELTNDREIHFIKTDSVGNLIVSPKTLIDTDDLNIYLDADYLDGDLFITWTNRPGNRTTMRQYGGVWDHTGNEEWSSCLVPDQLSGKGVVAATDDSFYVEWSDGRFNSLGDIYLGEFSSMNGQSQGENRIESTVEADIPMEIMVSGEGTDETIHLLWGHTHSNKMTRLSYASVDDNMDIDTEFTYLEAYQEDKYIEQERKATMISSEMSTDNIWVIYNQKQEPGNTVDTDLMYRIIDTGGNQITNVSVDNYLFDTATKMNMGTPYINTHEMTTYQHVIDFEDELGFISFPYISETDASCTADSHIFHILPDAGFTTSTEMVHVGEEITFDASDSSDLDGSIAAYQWDYYGCGDYHSYGEDPITSVTYDSFGKYTVSSLVTDDGGMSNEIHKEIQVIPNPRATMSPILTALVDEPVELDASSSVGYLDTCIWEIGDGSTSDGVIVEQIFNQQGNYPVNLEVTDVLGMQAKRYNVVRVVDPTIHRLNDNVVRSSKYGIMVKNSELNLEGADISDCEKGIEAELSCVALENSKIGMSSSYDIFSDPGSSVVTVSSQYKPYICHSSDGADDDGDGCTNVVEIYSGTDPQVVDTDGDGINDADDPNPNAADSDGDGLGDDQEYPFEVKWYEAEDHAYDNVQRVEEVGLSGGAAVKTWTDLSTRNILTLQETELGEGWYKIYFRAKSDDEKTIMVGVEGGLLPVQTYLMSDYYDWYSTPEFEFYGDTLTVWMGTYTGVGTEYVDRICIAKTKEAVTRFSDGESEKELTYVDGDTAAVEGDLHVKIPVGREIDRATVKLESISLCELVDQGSVQHAQIRYGDPVNLNFKFDQVDTIVYTDGPDTGYDVYFDGTRNAGILTHSIKLTKFPPSEDDPLIYMGDPGTVDISQMPYTDADESFVIVDTAVTFCVKLSTSDFGKIVMPMGYLGGFDWYLYTLVDVISGSGFEVADDLIYGEPKNYNYRFDTAESSLISGYDPYYDIYIDKTEDGGIETYSVVLTKDSTEQGNPLICNAGVNPDVEPSTLDYTEGDQSVIIGTKTGEDHSPIDGKTICLMMEDETYVKMVFPEGHQGYMNWYRYQVIESETGLGSHGGSEEDYGDPTNFNYMFSTDSMGHYSGADTAFDVWFVAETDGGVTTYSVKLTKDPTQQGNPLICDAGTDFEVSPSDLSYTDAIDSVATGTLENDVHYPLEDKTICVKLDDDEYGKLVFAAGHQGGFQWYYYEMVESELNNGVCTNQQISYREPLNLNIGFFPYVTEKEDGGQAGYDIYLDVDEDGDTRTYSVKLTKDPTVEGNPRIYDADDNTMINPTDPNEVEYLDNIDSVDVGTNVNGVDNPEAPKTICIKKSEHEFVKLVFENGHVGGYEWEQFSMESSQQEQGEHSLANGDYYDDNNLNFRFSIVEPEQRSLNIYGPDDAFDVYFRMIDKGGGCFDYEVALTDPDTTDDKRIHDADTNTLINPLEVEYTDEADSVVLGTVDGDLHIPIEDKTVCVQLGDGKYGKLVFPNGHLAEDGTGTGFSWYYYEVQTISGAFNVDIGDAPEAQDITVPDNNLLDIEEQLNAYRIAHQGDADQEGMIEIPISLDSNGDIQGKMLVKDLWIESFNKMALGQITDPDTDDTDFDGLSDSRERNENLWWFEAEHYASENELVEEVDHRDASNNKAVQGIAGSRIDDYGIPLVNLLKSEQLPLFSHGTEFQIYFRAKALAPSKFQVKVDDSNNQNKLNNWHLVGTEYRWYKTAYFGTLPGDKFMTIEINAERNACSGGSYGPTWGVYLDKVAVLRVTDGTDTYTGVDALTVSDCMNADTDEDGRTDGEEGGEILEFEAEDLTLDGQTVFGFGDDDWDGAGVGDEAFSEDVLESSNSRYVKRKGGGNDLMISPTELNTKLDGNMGGFYRLAARAKDPSGDVASLISFGTALPNVLPLETHDVTPEYRWYISEEFHTPDGDIQLDIKASHDSVMLDKIMLIKSTNLRGVGIRAADGQATSILDPDMDHDDIPDGGEADDNIWWFEAEHHEKGNSVVELDSSASNGICVKAPLAGNPGLLDRASFKATYPPGDYRVYARAKGGNEYCAWAVKMYMHIYTEEDLEHVPLVKREHVVDSSFRWYASDVFHIQNEGRLLFQVAAGMCNSGLKLDKIAVARVKDGDGIATGVVRRVISDPLDPDIDHDTAPDGMERSDDVWWFEAENHYAGGGIMEDFTASNSLSVKDAANAYEVHEDVLAGKYSYLIRAKTVAGVENAVLTLSGESGGNVEITNSQFNWYTTSLQVADDKEIILIGSGAEVMVDKIGLVRTEDSNEVLTGANPSKFGDQLDADTDGEGLLDGEEINGFRANDGSLYHSKPLDRDSDDDGLVDSKEVGKVGDADNGASTTDPLDKDTDGDGLPDGWIDGWGYMWIVDGDGEKTGQWGNYGEFFGLLNGALDIGTGVDGNNKPTPYDELIEGETCYFVSGEFEDRNLNGKPDLWDNNIQWNGGDGPGETRPDVADTDGGIGDDKLNDGEEILAAPSFNLHCGNPNHLQDAINPLKGADDNKFTDDDNDGLIYGLEDVNNDGFVDGDENEDFEWDEGETWTETYWLNEDTDGDSLLDGEEVGAGTDPLNVDSDGDDVWDGNGPGNPNDYYEIDWNLDKDGDGLKNAMDPDSDNDGMPDEWEYVKMQEFADMTGAEYYKSPVYPVRDDREKDEDIGLGWVDMDGKYHILGDGLTNWEEYAGQDDDPETLGDNTDPLDQDMDNDGLPDSEWRSHNTDPLNPDDDGDGLKDGEEDSVWVVTGINSATGIPFWPTISDPNEKDTDGDGLWDGDERYGDAVELWDPNTNDYTGSNYDGISSSYITDPDKPDSDDDGVLDGKSIICWSKDDESYIDFTETWNIALHEYDQYSQYVFIGELDGDIDQNYNPTVPTNCDTDFDGLLDGFDRDINGDGEITDDYLGEYGELSSHNGYGSTDPNDPNTDNPLPNDDEGDDLLDGEEILQGSNPRGDSDTDKDGLDDFEEWEGWDVTFDFPLTSQILSRINAYGWKKIWSGTDLIGYHIQSDPTSDDGDDDGLKDVLELNALSNPIDPDTDCDFIRDGAEYTHNDNNIIELNTDPCKIDSDADGLSDLMEISVVFRSNVGEEMNGINLGATGYNDPNAWIVVALDYDPLLNHRSLTGFKYKNGPFATSMGNQLSIRGQALFTAEGYEVNYFEGGGDKYLYIGVQDGEWYRYQEDENAPNPPLPNPFFSRPEPHYLFTEQYRYFTNPLNPDSDGDGVSDGCERAFNVDLDQEGMAMGACDPLSTPSQHLYVEVDYVVDEFGRYSLPPTDNHLPNPKFDPFTDVFDYAVAYYNYLGIWLHICIDDKLNPSDVFEGGGTLAAFEMYNEEVEGGEPEFMYGKNEVAYHDFKDTHLYVFYYLDEQSPWTWSRSWPSFGVIISNSFPATLESIDEDWRTHTITDQIFNNPEGIEYLICRNLFLHEFGHAIYIGIYDDYLNHQVNAHWVDDITWSHPDLAVVENYCGFQREPGEWFGEDPNEGHDDWCIMANFWPTNLNKYALYCQECWSTHNINLEVIHSVGDYAFWSTNRIPLTPEDL